MISNFIVSPQPDDEVARKVFVKGFSLHTSEDQLRNHFSQYGEVKNV